MRKVNSMFAIVLVLWVLYGRGFAAKNIKPATAATSPMMNELDAQQQMCLNMLQGTIVSTGNPLDLAIEGDGYIVLNDGRQDLYSRGRSFAIDADLMLVDPYTGYCVQRIGSAGEDDGFQIPGDNNIYLPYDIPLPGKATSEIKVQGNLSSDAQFPTTQTQRLKSNLIYTVSDIVAIGSTKLINLDQFAGIPADSKIYVTGIKPDGTAVTDSTGMGVSSTTTLGDMPTYINNKLGASNATASLVNGRICITDNSSGYSRTDIALFYDSLGTDTMIMPAYFETSVVGGEEVKNIAITVYDSQGDKHVLYGAFVRTDTPNIWDMVLTSISGDIYEITPDNGRICSITFNPFDGSFGGCTDTPEFVIDFAGNSEGPQTITIDMGTPGQFDGLTQFAGSSTAVARHQDGYEPGNLLSVSVNNRGVIIGAFSNGIKRDIATIRMAMFQNVCGLESIGSGYFLSSDDSGDAMVTQALSNGAGPIHDKALERLGPKGLIEDAIDEIGQILEKEWFAYDDLEQMLENGDFGHLKKGDIVKAKQKIYSAMQHQQQFLDALEKSIEKLEDAVTALGVEPLGDEMGEE